MKRANKIIMTYLTKAILLIGPTGSGKSPSGDFLEKAGLKGCACHHFDFGEHLRKIVADGHSGICEPDRLFLKTVLSGGALLENERFYLAETILRGFIKARGIAESDLLVLNGLPRHVDQAEDVCALVDIVQVVCFDCSPAVICERIAKNSGGDRTGRTDDAQDAIAAKLTIFKERTLPLLEYFQNREVPVHKICVDTTTQPVDVCRLIKDSV